MKISRIIAVMIAALVLLTYIPASADSMVVIEGAEDGAQPDAVKPIAEGAVEEPPPILEDGASISGQPEERSEAVEDTSEETMFGYAKRDDVKIYEENSIESEVLVTLRENDWVQVISEKGDWCKVIYESREGYVLKADLSEKPVTGDEPAASVSAEEPKSVMEPENAPGLESDLEPAFDPEPAKGAETPKLSVTGYAKRDDVRVFRRYSLESEVFGTLKQNGQVQVTSAKGDWLKVIHGSEVGYVLKADLAVSPVNDGMTTAPADAEEPVAGTETEPEDEPELEDSFEPVDEPAIEIEPEAEDEPEAEATPGQVVFGYVKMDGALVYESASTSSPSLATLDIGDKVQVTSAKGDWCRVIYASSIAYMLKTCLSTVPVVEDGMPPETTDQEDGAALEGNSSELPEEVAEYSAAKPAKGTAIEVDWWKSDIQEIFPRGGTATVTDVETGISWNVSRKGGTNHADAQPLTAADTDSMKAACGSWSWARRAIFVTIDGVNYAASMNCMPHGEGSISNNGFNGHYCIHFVNSRTHGGNKVCPQHQSAIQTALKASM